MLIYTYTYVHIQYIYIYMHICINVHICVCACVCVKSRNITLPTKVCIVKVMVFPVVKYSSENWTIKMAERQRIDSFKL